MMFMDQNPEIANKQTLVELENRFGLIFDTLNQKYNGVVLYGSMARGDGDDSSDLDLLCLAHEREENYVNGKLSIAVYTENELRQLFMSGSLFALHLIKEGIIVRDGNNLLHEIFALYEQPDNYDSLKGELKRAGALTDLRREEFELYPYNFIRLARYIVRSASIIRHIEKHGVAAFSITKLSAALQENEIAILVPDRHINEVDWDTFCRTRALAQKVMKTKLTNPYSSLHKLVEETKTTDPKISFLGDQLIKGEQFSFIRLFATQNIKDYDG